MPDRYIVHQMVKFYCTQRQQRNEASLYVSTKHTDTEVGGGPVTEWLLAQVPTFNSGCCAKKAKEEEEQEEKEGGKEEEEKEETK